MKEAYGDAEWMWIVLHAKRSSPLLSSKRASVCLFCCASTAASANPSSLGEELEILVFIYYFYLQSRHQHPNPEKTHFCCVIIPPFRTVSAVRFLIPGKPRRHQAAFLPPPALLCVCLLCPAQQHSSLPACDSTPAPSAPQWRPLTDTGDGEMFLQFMDALLLSLNHIKQMTTFS